MKIEKSFQKPISQVKKLFKKLSKTKYQKYLKNWTKTKMD